MNKDELVLGIDIDGCLAQFNEAFKRVQIETSGRDLFPADWSDEQITCWNWPTDQYGYSKEEYKAAWEVVWTNPKFWKQLRPYDGAIDFLKAIRKLSDNIYYITQRKGVKVKAQTEWWLRSYGAGDDPTVLISDDKAGACKALHITHYLDDKDENCLSVIDTQFTKVWMPVRGWNHQISIVPRITSLMEFVEGVKSAS